jgi:hypothetical protein
MRTDKLRAIDVLNWDYLVSLSELFDPSEKIKTADHALRAFAYSFVSTANNDHRDGMLAAILTNATRWNSSGPNETYVRWLSQMLDSDLDLLRNFAKQVSVSLRRG